MDIVELIHVAITGTLSKHRSEVAQLINATANGRFVESVNLQTHYLVASKYDSKKARIAAQYGTTVISEAELDEYLAAGAFPPTGLPSVLPRFVNNFPDITWTAKSVPQLCLLTYVDALGRGSIRRVLVTHHGVEGIVKYIGGHDGAGFKSYRDDRIESIDMLDALGKPA